MANKIVGKFATGFSLQHELYNQLECLSKLQTKLLADPFHWMLTLQISFAYEVTIKGLLMTQKQSENHMATSAYVIYCFCHL